jgi:cysteinyl-tRNA synthetase
MIEALIANDLAYIGGNGDVFYAVTKFKNYGQLSGKHLDDLQAGERVDVDLAKRNPLDFVLWKMAKAGEPSWPSPWGLGRPGWHIECSAMSTCCLGNHFDIHGGGMDLQFPHHENEIAQSEGATGEKFVNLWMHNGFVRINEEKMSKSLGNFFTVREVLKQYKPEIIRFFILSSHYRSPLNYSDEQLHDARTALTRLYTALRGCDGLAAAVDADYKARFEQAMDDDFNTPVALSVLFDLARELNSAKEAKSEKIHLLADTLKQLGGLLGILQDDPEGFLKSGVVDSTELTAVFIEQQIQDRLDAKKAKNWALADQIRNDLKAQGVILEDAPDGTTSWRRE